MILLLLHAALDLVRLRREARPLEGHGLALLDDHLLSDLGLPPRVAARPMPPRPDWF